MPIILAGVSHHTTPLEVRERFYFPENDMSEWLDQMSQFPSVSERVILSTCNRVELYGCAESYEQGVDAIYDFLMESRGLRHDELAEHLYVQRDEAATRHLFRVASSLDSMVLGEPQILGQVKEAYRIAQEAGHAGKTLTALFSRAFRVAKKVRDQTALGKKAVSISSVAAELAGRIFGTLEDKSVLLLGAGEMAELAARHVVGHGAKTLLVANRTYSKAEALAVAGRLGVPVVLFAALAARNTLTGHAPDGASALSLVSPAQCAGAIGGFLAYKAPLLGRQLGMAIAEYSKPEAQAPLGMGGGLPTGSLGIALRVAQERRAARSWSAGFQHGACPRCPQRPIGPLGVSVGPGRAYFHLSAA